MIFVRTMRLAGQSWDRSESRPYQLFGTPTAQFRNLAAALMLVAASILTVSAQEVSSDSAWQARMTALQEEQDAQAGTAVFIVFDDSGSMNDDNKLVMAKKSFRAWIEHAPEDYRFSLTAINAGKLVPLARHNRARVLAAVDKLRASGNTPLADTIAAVWGDIVLYRGSGAAYVREVVVILTDGEDNTKRGDAGVRYEMNRLRSDSVEVIAFGYKGEADYLNGAATHFYSPNNGQDISKGLNAISAEVRDTSDVVVDDATRKLMATLPAVTSMHSAPAGTPAPSATPSLASRTPGGVGWKTVFVVIGCILVLRGFSAAARSESKR